MGPIIKKGYQIKSSVRYYDIAATIKRIFGFEDADTNTGIE